MGFKPCHPGITGSLRILATKAMGCTFDDKQFKKTGGQSLMDCPLQALSEPIPKLLSAPISFKTKSAMVST